MMGVGHTAGALRPAERCVRAVEPCEGRLEEGMVLVEDLPRVIDQACANSLRHWIAAASSRALSGGVRTPGR